MPTTRENAHKLLQLFESMRHAPPGPAFRRVTDLDLSFTHLRTMSLLLPDKTLAMKDLAEHLCMTPPSVTALTRRLVQTGLVRRQNHPQDQRVALLSLTDEGRELMEQLYEGRVRGMELLLEGLTPEDQQLIIQLLERAVQAMTAAPVRADE
jgi:DNA-binding MarR family transcriptional regulator